MSKLSIFNRKFGKCHNLSFCGHFQEVKVAILRAISRGQERPLPLKTLLAVALYLQIFHLINQIQDKKIL